MKSLRIKKFPKQLKSYVLIFCLSVFAGEIHSAVNQIPAPRNLEEAKKMMRFTLDLHILPSGANPEILEKIMEVGEVLLFFDHLKGIPWLSAAGILIRAPVEQVYSVILDHPHYPEFVPMTEGVESRELFPGFYQDDLHMNIKFAFIHYRMDYGTYAFRQPPYRMDWSLAWGEFERNIGFWELIPSADKKSTMAFYAVYSEPRSKFLKMLYSREPTLEMMTNVSAGIMLVQAIKAEAEKRQGVKPCSFPPASWSGIQEIWSRDPKSLSRFLERGKLLILLPAPAKGGTVYLIAGALVNSEIENTYRLLTDFPSYPEFVDGVKKVECQPAGENRASCRWELEFDLSVLKYQQTPEWHYEFSPPHFVSWQIERPCCGPAPGFWQLIPQEGKTIIFNGTTADIRSLGRIPRYALSVEPTLEHAAFASQGILLLNALKKRIEGK